MNRVSRQKKHLQVRKNLMGDVQKPRLCVFRSNQHIYAQLIDDQSNRTLVAASDLKINSGTKKEKATKVGEQIASLAKGKKITKVVFDRGGFRYHGRVAALADGARKGGLEF